MHITILENTNDISKKDEFINTYNLKFIDKYKCYNIFDTYIHSNSKTINFEKYKYINDKKYKIESIIPFSFYDVHNESIYEKYMNDKYILKCYKNRLILELIDNE